MKELSIEQKVKACDSNYKVYTELINRLENVKEAIKKQNYGIAMDVLCKPYPEFQVTTHSELKGSEDEDIKHFLVDFIKVCRWTEKKDQGWPSREKCIAWLEKQSNLMKALQISNAKIGELIEKNYYLKEQLEKQGEHANFLSKIQVGDKVTRNEDGVLVNISQLNRVAKKRKNQGNNMGISKATKHELEDNLNKALEKETPESWNKFLDEQGEQKPFGKRDECLHCQFNYAGECKGFCAMKRSNRKPHKSVDKVESKLKIEEGKWYVCTQTYVLRGKIVVIKGQIYQAEKDNVIKGEDGCLFIDRHDGKASDYFRLWTIQDVKDGDILCSNQVIVLFKQWENNTDCCYIIAHAGIDIIGALQITNGHWLISNKSKPATKEQRDLLFQKIKDAGYEWDAEKKELKKIEEKKDIHNKLTAFEFSLKHIIEEAIECGDIHNLKADADLLLRIARKTSWSEEDERTYKSVLYSFAHNYPLTVQQQEFIKSLRPQINITDEELAQAKKDAYNDVLDKIEYDSENPTFDDGWSAAIWYLKKRNAQPQTTWKPSDEQMVAVQEAMNIVGILTITGSKINSLYQDLKKLKEK